MALSIKLKKCTFFLSCSVFCFFMEKVFCQEYAYFLILDRVESLVSGYVSEPFSIRLISRPITDNSSRGVERNRNPAENLWNDMARELVGVQQEGQTIHGGEYQMGWRHRVGEVFFNEIRAVVNEMSSSNRRTSAYQYGDNILHEMTMVYIPSYSIYFPDVNLSYWDTDFTLMMENGDTRHYHHHLNRSTYGSTLVETVDAELGLSLLANMESISLDSPSSESLSNITGEEGGSESESESYIMPRNGESSHSDFEAQQSTGFLGSILGVFGK